MRILTASFLFLSVIFAAQGQVLEPFSISLKSSNGNFSIVGECSEIKEELQSLKQLRPCDPVVKSVDSSFADNQCEAQINECLPDHLIDLHGHNFDYTGPNCYGTALTVAGFYNHFRFVSEEEFARYIADHCERVERPQPGDIGVFKIPNSVNVHAFYYLSRSLVFEKHGPDGLAGKYPMNVSLRSYTNYNWFATPECRRFGGPNKEKECFNQNYFVRCQAKTVESVTLEKEVDDLTLFIEESLDKKWSRDQMVYRHEEMVRSVTALERHLLSSKISRQRRDLLREQIKSIKIQMKVFSNKLECAHCTW